MQNVTNVYLMGVKICTKREMNMYPMAIKNICGAGKMDGYRIKKKHLRHGVDIGRSKKMEYATRWVTTKVTSHQISYRVAKHSVTIMVETRWLQSANFGVHPMAIKNICGAGKMDGY